MIMTVPQDTFYSTLTPVYSLRLQSKLIQYLMSDFLFLGKRTCFSLPFIASVVLDKLNQIVSDTEKSTQYAASATSLHSCQEAVL